jgi:hypothetical protein
MKMKTKGIMAVLFVAAFASAVFAYIPENTPENSFEQRILAPFDEVSGLVNDGIKAVNQTVASSNYSSEHKSQLAEGGLVEKESGGEAVTSTDNVYYEPKEEIYEAKEMMEEMFLWLTVYKTTEADDVVTFNKLKTIIKAKMENLHKLIDALKYEKDNKDSVLRYKIKIKKNDKDFQTYLKMLKGKIVLIQGKPLPEDLNK